MRQHLELRGGSLQFTDGGFSRADRGGQYADLDNPLGLLDRLLAESTALANATTSGSWSIREKKTSFLSGESWKLSIAPGLFIAVMMTTPLSGWPPPQ